VIKLTLLEQILIYGEDETTVPAKFGDSYKKIASSKGDNVTVITVKIVPSPSRQK